MKHRLFFGLALSFLTMGLTPTASAQTVSVFDTVYVPPGYPDGPGTATIYLPEIRNGIGVVLVHGCGNPRTDSRRWCDTLASYGYVAMSIEYPDPCVTPGAVYPKKTRAVKLAVEFLRRNAVRFGITTGKIVGFGFSQGAGTWGEAIVWDNDDAYFQTDSTMDDHLNAAVLLYGSYEAYASHIDSADWDNYFSHDSLRAIKGSPIRHVGNITTPVLLMHGTADNSTPYERSVQLHDSLIAQGKESQLLPFIGQDHGFDVIWPVFNVFTPAGLIAKDTALAFLRRTVAPRLKIHVHTPSIDLGNVLVAESDTATAIISNIGSSPLSVNAITNATTQFSLPNLPTLPAIIPAGGSLQFRAAFHPSVQGVSWDTIRIVTDDSLHQLARITLHGKGISVISPASAGVLYATSGAAPSGYLYSMNTATGAISTIGSLGPSEIHGLAIRPSDNVLYGSYDTPTATTLYRISSESGDAVHTLVIPVGNLHAIAFSPGDTLYGATTTGSLYRIDLTTGHADSVGTAPGLSYYGLSFRPGLNQLWACVRTPMDSILTLNTTTGAATFVGVTGFNALTYSLAFDPGGSLFGLIDNGSGEGYLANIDTATGGGTIIAGPLDVSFLQAIAMGPGTVDVKDGVDRGVPLVFEMHQNYPNPFNPSTAIQFAIPVGTYGRTSLRVYDVLGRDVATLVNEVKQPGTYTVQFDARLRSKNSGGQVSGLTSGVYFYRLQAGDFVQTRKLMLLR